MQAGWDALDAAVATARAELVAAAPDPATAAEGEACLVRVVTSSLSDAFLRHQLTEGGLTRAVPTMGGPNPDYLMSSAAIDPGQRYRLEGCLHDSERVAVGLYSIGADGALLLVGHAAFDRGRLGADGCFALDLTAEADGERGLRITPDCRVLLVRTLHRRPDARACTLTLVGGSANAADLAVPTGTCDGGLEQAAQRTLRTVRQFIEWTRLISATPNRFAPPHPSIAEAARGDADTDYFFGYFDLDEGEWLEALIPGEAHGYWSLHAYNHWLEALPGAGVHDLSAVAEPDGRIRVRIGPAVAAELPNGVNTLGRRRGGLIFCSIGVAGAPAPESKVRGHPVQR